MRPCLGAHRPAVSGPSQQVAAKAKAPVRLPRAQPVPLQALAVTPSLPQRGRLQFSALFAPTVTRANGRPHAQDRSQSKFK